MLSYIFSRTYDAIVGVVSNDYFDDLPDTLIRRGLPKEQKDRMLQTFVRNQYSAHLQEILLTLQNEYSNWAEEVETPDMIKGQVSKL